MTADPSTHRRNVRLAGGIALIAGLVVVALVVAPDQGDKGAAPKPPARPEAACGAQAPERPEPRSYDGPEEVTEPGVDYGAVITTSCGTIAIDLLEDQAPQTVNNFVFLAREGFYDGLIWHRVEQNSVIQTGDPNGINGEPPEGPGYTIPDELPDKASDYVYGVVGMANRGPDTGGSQFFIVIHHNRPAGYQPFYSIFGVVTGGSFDGSEEDIGCNPLEGDVQTLEIIGCQPTRGGNDPAEAVKPVVPVYIESIEITEA